MIFVFRFLLAYALALMAPQRQVPGFAEITEPGEGQSVTGIVTIFGTASHPAFESFELAFSFDPDPTDTWFRIGEALDTPVVDGRLAIWDTTEITDGSYRVRLRVNIDGSPSFETIVGGIQIANYTPTATPPPAAASVIPTASASPVATALAEVEVAVESPSRFSTSLRAGVLLGLLFMLAAASYVRLAPRVRSYAGYLRMRQMHRRQDRARPPGRKQEGRTRD